VTSPIPAAALDGALSVIGASGAGKTYVAKGAVEQLLALGRRVCIIDPLDVWYGLKTSADGERPAFPVVVFGGEHADVPIGVDAGAELGRIIAEGTVQFSIVCTAEMTGGEKARFLTPFFEKLYAANKAPLHLVLDEADEVAPQSPMPEVMRLKGAVDKIARRGRVKGFRLLTITQRPAVRDKSVLSQIGTLVAMQLTSPQDRKAIEGWVKGNADENMAKDVLASLAKLARGEGWIWSPRLGVLDRVTFPPITTLDTSRTPEHGEAIVEAKAAASVDISAIRVALAPPAVDVSADPVDRRALKAIGETAAGMAQQVKDAEQRGYQRGLAEGEARGFVRGQALAMTRMRATLDALRIDEIPAGSPVSDDGRKDVGPEGNHRQQPNSRPHPFAEASAGGTLNSAGLSEPHRRVVNSIAWWHSVGFEVVKRNHAAVTAKYSPNASTFGVYIASLVKSGHVEAVAGAGVKLTDLGRSVADATRPEPALESAKAMLSNRAAELLGIVAEAFPAEIDRKSLADRMGLSRTASTLGVYISEASALGLIEISRPGMVRAAAFLFAAQSEALKETGNG